MSARTPRPPAPEVSPAGFMRIEAVARRLDVNVQIVSQLIKDGKLTACRFSARVIRVHEDALAAFVEEMKGGKA